jgi:putative phosphoesterase
VDHILHAGDVGDPLILDKLRWIAPLTAIRGNVDTSGVCRTLPATYVIELGGRYFYLVHSVHDLDLSPKAAGIAVVVSGHTHRAESMEERQGVLYLNPGSAGPKPFRSSGDPGQSERHGWSGELTHHYPGGKTMSQ